MGWADIWTARYALSDTEPWNSGRVLLRGDAAHACSPNMAQRGSLAIEDAVVLAEVLDIEDAVVLAELLDEASDVDSALDEYVTDTIRDRGVEPRRDPSL